jgi:hypothetical protein
MDWEAFENDVWKNVNDSLYTAQEGSLDDSDPYGGYTGIVVTIGETWQGALYGAEQNTYGQRAVYQFATETEQRDWFAAMCGPVGWEDYADPYEAIAYDNGLDNECSCGGIGCQV